MFERSKPRNIYMQSCCLQAAKMSAVPLSFQIVNVFMLVYAQAPILFHPYQNGKWQNRFLKKVVIACRRNASKSAAFIKTQLNGNRHIIKSPDVKIQCGSAVRFCKADGSFQRFYIAYRPVFKIHLIPEAVINTGR